MAGEDSSHIVLKAKIEWYRDILSLEPNSKIFLPFARYLADMGLAENNPKMLNEAFDVLRRGLLVYPDFMEARLFLIELLNTCDCRSQCGAEVARLASLFLSYPDFWDAWREYSILENESSDFAVALGFMSAILRDKSVSIVQVLEAGLASLRSPVTKKIMRDLKINDCNSPEGATGNSGTNFDAQMSQESMDKVSSFLEKKAQSTNEIPAPVSAPANPASVASMPAPVSMPVPANVPVSMPVPTNEEHDEENDDFPQSHVANDENYAQKHEEASRSTKETLAALLADASIVVEPMEKAPFRTRSMAEILFDQGDFNGAIGIYKELIAKASDENAPVLEKRLAELEALPDSGKAYQEDISGLLAIDDLVDTSFGIFAEEERAKKDSETEGTVNTAPNKILADSAVDLLNKLATRLEEKAG